MNNYGILIIDMWNEHFSLYRSFAELIEHYTRNIGILLDNTLGTNNIPTVLACYDISPNNLREPHPTLKHRCEPNNRRDNSNRMVSTERRPVIDFFKSHSVETIYYAGQSLPGCIEARPLGLESLRGQFSVKIIADCTLDLYNAHKSDYDRINEMYRYLKKKGYDYVFSTDIIEDFKKAEILKGP